MVAKSDRHGCHGRPGPLTGKGTREGEQGGLCNRAVLPAKLDEPIRTDAADGISAEGTVVNVEEHPDRVVSEDGRSVVRADVHAHRSSGVGSWERRWYRRVEPVVRAAGATVIDDAIAIDVAVGLRVRDPVVVEVVRHRVRAVGHAVPIRVREGRRILGRRLPGVLRRRRARKDSTRDVGI